MILDSRHNDFDVDHIVSGYYIGPDGEGVCRYHNSDYVDEDDVGGFDFKPYLKTSKVDESKVTEGPTSKEVLA